MDYQSNKAEVLSLFDNHIIKYVVKDLEVLDSIEPDDSGAGACTIPQAISTFAALDLIGYLVHSQNTKPVHMSFTEIINNETYFPEIKQYSSITNFLVSFRDNLRSIMAHRFLLAKYDITKSNTEHLFFQESGRQIFNTSYFTKMTIGAIWTIYNKIKEDSLIINGLSKELTMEKLKNRIGELRNFKGKGFSHLNNLPESTTTQTTSSMG